MNKLILLGRLTAAPELHTTQSGKSTVSFTVAVNRRYKQEGQPDADFIRCIAWNNTAENICKYFDKGTRICIEGRIQTRTYEKDGQKRYATECIVDQFDFCEKKSSSNNELGDDDFYAMDGDEPPF